MIEAKQDSVSNTITLGSLTAEGVHIKVASPVITTTEDKLRLALLERQGMIISRDAWIGPLGIFVTILLTIIATDFRRFLLDAETWKAVFIAAGLMSFAWLVYTLSKRPKNQSIDEFIQKFK